MKLYSERSGKRLPIEKTYKINRDAYSLLFNCCEHYKKNLTHLFTLNCQDNWTGDEYIAFNEDTFMSRIKIRIPDLFRDDFDRIIVPGPYDTYDQYALLDYIEFFAQNMQDIDERWNNIRYKNYKHIECLDSSDIFIDFKEEINQIFIESGLLYKLTDQKIIERIVESDVLTKEIEERIEKIDEDGVKKLLKDSIELYKTPNPEARQDSVEKIWDAFERLKTYYTTENKKKSIERIINDMSHGDEKFKELFNAEFDTLTKIGNNYRIRHHETDRIDIIDNRYYDYFFNRCLSLIALAIQYLN